MEELAAAFEQACASTLGGRKWFAHYEQWLWARRSACGAGAAGGVLVLPTGRAARRDPELARKLERAGLGPESARRVCVRLGRRCEALARRVEGESAGGAAQVAVVHEPDSGGDAQLVRLECLGAKVSCSPPHLAKLRALHARHGGGATRFDAAAFCVLARLHSLQGAHARAGGMQAALHGEVFDVLHSEFGCIAECFASPLNCRWGRYCSAAPDADACFGSLGGFQEFRPEAGSFEANPPFDPRAVADMAAHMDELLVAAEAKDSPLCFVVVVPSWPDQACWCMLRDSAFRRATLALAQADHGYCEGAQHYRPTRHRVSNHDSTVFILQTSAAHRLWPPTTEALRRLSAAFRPRRG